NRKPPYEKVCTSSPALSREKRSKLTPGTWMDCRQAPLRQIPCLTGSAYQTLPVYLPTEPKFYLCHSGKTAAMKPLVSVILAEKYGITAAPGAKVACPFCHQRTFSIKPDDSLGKCFHPTCGRFLAPSSSNGQYAQSLASVLQGITDDFHQELLGLDPH